MILLDFPVIGSYFPSDHNYGLYASLIHFNGKLRSLDWQLGTISGTKQHNGLIRLGSQSSLSIRCEKESIQEFIGIDHLTVGKWLVTLNTPTIHQLNPSFSLLSRIVTIKGAETVKDLSLSLLKQSQEMGIMANYAILERKTIKIKYFTVIGFKVAAYCESEKDSLILQKIGIGGKRKMGCGVFFPF